MLISFLKSVIMKFMFSESITIEFSLTIPPILIFFLLISVKLLISVGEKKYTNYSKLCIKTGIRESSKSWWKIELNKKIIRYV